MVTSAVRITTNMIIGIDMDQDLYGVIAEHMEVSLKFMTKESTKNTAARMLARATASQKRRVRYCSQKVKGKPRGKLGSPRSDSKRAQMDRICVMAATTLSVSPTCPR